MQGFVEHREDGPVYLTSPLLPCRHAFTTRFGGVSEGVFESLNLGEHRGDAPEKVRENYRRLCLSLGVELSSLVFSRQVHGGAVRVVSQADRHELFSPVPYEADALVTNRTGLTLTVFTADCVPVLLCDPVSGVVAAAHCGWRSSVQDILGGTVEAMSSLGARAENIRAAIGPAIGGCCFETDSDVPEAVFRWLGGDAEALVSAREGAAGKYLVDLKGANRVRLLQLGLAESHVAVSPDCTMCLSGKYWSHRVTKGVRGSQAALIAL